MECFLGNDGSIVVEVDGILHNVKFYDHEGLSFMELTDALSSRPCIKDSLDPDDESLHYTPMTTPCPWVAIGGGVYIDETRKHPQWQRKPAVPRAPRPPKQPKKKLDWRATMNIAKSSAVDLSADDTLPLTENLGEIVDAKALGDGIVEELVGFTAPVT